MLPGHLYDEDMALSFTAHPQSIGESYTEHARCASHFAKELALAAMAAGVHAVFPCFFEKTASTKIKCLHTEMTTGNRAENCEEEAALLPHAI